MRRLKRILLLLVASVLVLEVVLQIGSLVVAPSRRAEPVPPEGDAVILCVGDSFTHGMGASRPEAAYPRQLETLLNAPPGRNHRVVTYAWPGQSSRDVLERLPTALHTYRPALVYILIGINDAWVLPEELRVDPEAAPPASLDRPAFRWRIPRLIAWVRGAVRGSPPSGEPPDVAPPRTEVRAHTLRYDELTDLARRGRTQELRTYVAGLEERVREPGPGHEHLLEALITALQVTESSERCLELCETYVVQYPKNPILWQAIAWASDHRGDARRAREAADRALAHSADRSARFRGALLFRRADATVADDPVAALQDYFRGYLLQRDLAALRGKIDKHAWPQTAFAEALAALQVGDGDRAALEAALAAIRAGDDFERMARIYASHLRQMVDLCRARGARVALVTYPFRINPRELGRTRARVASEAGCGLVDAAAVFDRRLAGQRREDYFVPDGHCNDAGYRILAEAVASDAAARLASLAEASPGSGAGRGR